MRTVFFDIDTQIDFLYPAGALYVPRAERLLGTIARLNRYAAANGIPLVSTVDAHAENDPEFRQWPAHCVAGTLGQRKPAQTLTEPRVVLPGAHAGSGPDGARQIILEKQRIDLFTDPNLQQLIGRLNADRYVVYGVVTEYCVRSAALGLARSGKAVELVTDAIEALSEAEGRRTLDEFTSAGGRLTRAAAIWA